MSQFQYKEIDPEGWQTLDVIADADNFNKWMYNTIRPYCRGRILEVGSGIGNISKFFIEEKADIALSDIRSNYCDKLKEKFPTAREIVLLDLVDPDFDIKYAAFLGGFDSVFALNVVEHIDDHLLAIKNCNKLLAPGGHLIILVPAFQALYNRFDIELEHFRRYNKKMLNDVMRQGGLQLIHDQYFNFMGIFGWYVSGKLQKNKTIPKGQMSLYDKLVPIFKFVDAVLLRSAGLSVISVGRKKQAS